MEKYQRRLIAQGSGATPQAPAVPAPGAETGAARIARGLDDFMKAAGPVMARAYAAEQTARVDDALLTAQGKMDLFEHEYRQAIRGGMANAQELQDKWAELSAEAIREFDGKGNEVFRGLLEQRLKERGLNVARNALQYEAAQREVWLASQEKAQQDELLRNASANPDDLAGMIREREAFKGSLAAKHPGQDLQEQFNSIDEKTALAMAEGLLAKGDTQGLRALLANQQLMTGGRTPVGSISRLFESGKLGLNCVAYDANGGTSYGPHQLSSRQGSYQGWLELYASKGGKAAEIARRLRESGNPNTGTTSGRPVEAYRQAVREDAAGIEASQREYIEKSLVAPALAALPRRLREEIERDPGLMEMAYSTAVQHGPGGAARILSGQWQEGMDRHAYIESVYDERAQPHNFRSSTPQVQAAVFERMKRERVEIHNFRSGRNVLDAKTQASLLARADALERQRQATGQDELRATIANYIAASEAGNVLDIPVTEQQLARTFGDFQGSQLWRDVQESRELALDMSMLGSMTPAARANLLQERNPDPLSPTFRQDLSRFEKLTQAVAQLEKGFREDAAGTVLSLDANAARARAAFLATMTPETGRQYVAAMRGAMAARGAQGPIFSKADARALADQFQQSDDPVAFAASMRQSLGRDYPEAVAALSTSLSPVMHLVASDMEPGPGRLIVQASRDPDFQKNSRELLRLRGSDSTDFDDAIRDKLGSLPQSFLAGNNADTPLAFQEALANLSLQYMRLNGPAMKMGDAIDRAYNEIIATRYHLLEPGGFFSRKYPACRIPKQYDPDEIREGLEIAAQELRPEDLWLDVPDGADPELIRPELDRLVKNNTWWVTDTDEQGVVLYLEGRAVRHANGQPVRLLWNDILARRRERKTRELMEQRMSATGGNFPPKEME